MKDDSIFISKDKQYSPFLFACSQRSLVMFVDESVVNGVVMWEFSPEPVAKELIKKFEMRLSVGIPEKDLIEAVNSFWRRVSDAKDYH